MNTYSCKVCSVKPLNHSVYEVILSMEPGVPLPFQPGQYLHLIHNNKERSAFSIARGPDNDLEIELHILRDPNQGSSVDVLDYLHRHTKVQISAAQGRCTLIETDDRPVLMVAAGTGFAQAKSLLEGAFSAQLQQPLRLYWGVRQHADYYHLDLIERWQRQWPHFAFIPVVENPVAWTGRTGLLSHILLEDLPRWRDCHLYLSGSPAMVYACTDILASHQLLNKSRTYSDVFDYAPRVED